MEAVPFVYLLRGVRVLGLRLRSVLFLAVCRPDGWTATHPYCFNGAITRTVEDSALMLEYMARYDARDPLSVNHGFRKFYGAYEKAYKRLEDCSNF